MQPTRIRNAAARVLGRGTRRALDLHDLARILADEERIQLSPEALAATLRGADSLVVLEPADPIALLPLAVREAAPAYSRALCGAPQRCTVLDAQQRSHQEPATLFDALAAPLLQVWREAGADAPLRAELTGTLAALHALLPALEDAQARVRQADHHSSSQSTA